MREKPPGEALVEMESFDPGGPLRRSNGVAVLALTFGVIVAMFGLLLWAAQPHNPLPATWWHALLVLGWLTTLMALVGWNKSRSPLTTGRKRSITALILGLLGIVLALTVGNDAFSRKAPLTPRTGTKNRSV